MIPSTLHRANRCAPTPCGRIPYARVQTEASFGRMSSQVVNLQKQEGSVTGEAFLRRLFGIIVKSTPAAENVLVKYVNPKPHFVDSLFARLLCPKP